MRSTVFICVLLLCILTTGAIGQSAPRHPGIALFQQGRFPEAIRSLEVAIKTKEYKTDAELWNYLGLAYVARDNVKKSIKAFERSVDIEPGNSTFQGNLAYAYLINRQIDKAQSRANKAIELDPKNSQAYQVRSTANFWEGKVDPAEQDADMFIQLAPENAEAYLLKSDILVAKLGIRAAAGHTPKGEIGFLKRAVDALTLGVSKSNGHPRYAELQRELESITVFQVYLARDRVLTPPAAPAEPTPGSKPLRILSKAPAKYTDRARSANVSGTVRILALMGINGKVEHVLVIKPLGHGLDQQAIKAAKMITFEPKMTDGKPVPTVITLEYSFTIY